MSSEQEVINFQFFSGEQTIGVIICQIQWQLKTSRQFFSRAEKAGLLIN